MKTRKNTSDRTGAALLVVLIIVMAITITALGFVSQSDVELLCGQNMVMRAQMDYLAESGLEHARGLVLNPQDVRTPGFDYWRGEANLQLTSSNDFYDVTVTRDASDLCNYTIDCDAYRLEGVETIGLSRLQAVLRLDPCIAYWTGLNTTVWPQMTIDGDVYCNGNVTNNGTINGDVFALGTISGTDPQGQKKPAAEAGIIWPNLAVADFGPAYYVGATEYLAELIAGPNIPMTPFNPTGGNPAGICYSGDDVEMPGSVTINGTLVISGDLTVSGANNVITAEPNFPALLISGQVVMKDGGSLIIQGLAQIGGPIAVDPNTTSASVQVIGGLFSANGGVTSDKISVNIAAAPAIASIETWPAATAKRWGPAGGAFFRSLERIP
ncbi:MAG: hypothetical protein JSW66_13250 [Phycisphaerales bacterium]|nr:MAG: hypothetical protein JSW66_13250 [Phycisphaerales bacterium]